MTKLISVLSAIIRAGCGVFGLRMAEEPTYQVLNVYDDVQIRRYPALVVAQTEVNADYQNSSRLAFQRLAGYIFGNNKKQQTLVMTVPVIQQQVAENIAMTAPVVQEKLRGAWLMAFVLPQG